MARKEVFSWRHPYGLVATTVLTGVLAFIVVSPRSCADVPHCTEFHRDSHTIFNVCATSGLYALFLHEAVAVFMAYQSSKVSSRLIAGVDSAVTASLLVCLTFLVLALQNSAFALSSNPWYAHATPAGVLSQDDLPVYTITYVEWLFNVPILLTLAGKCALGNSFQDIARPIVVTNVYIILSWMAYFVANPLARWMLVALAFSMYAFASVDMVGWVQKFRRECKNVSSTTYLKPYLTFGLIAIFGVYGLVYVAAMLSLITRFQERMFYSSADIASKITMSIAFGGIRASEYHELLITYLVNSNLPFKRQESDSKGSEFSLNSDLTRPFV